MLFICQWMKFSPNTSFRYFNLISLFKGSCLYIASPLKFIDTNFVAQQMVRFYKCSLCAVVFSTSVSPHCGIFVCFFLFCFCFCVCSICQFLLNTLTMNVDVLCCVWFCVFLPYAF